MNQYLSVKLKVISLISMIMVVFLHSSNITMKFNSGNLNFNNKYNLIIQTFISEGITRIAVPIFFCISGYLFFLNFKGNINEFITKYQKRARSLLIPYLLWSVWGLVFYFVLQTLPQSKNFFTKELIINYSFGQILDAIFINPIPYQLWFIRDLIILVVFSPVIYWLIKRFKIIPILSLFIIWLDLFPINLTIPSSEAVLYFSLGAYLSLYKSDYLTQKLNQKTYILFFCLWILLVFIKTINFYDSHEMSTSAILLHKISIVIGMLALWSVYDIYLSKYSSIEYIIYLSQFSFFLYAFHEPILTIVNKGLFYLAGASEIASIVIYFVAPILTIFSGIILGSFLKKYCLKFYELITGAR